MDAGRRGTTKKTQRAPSKKTQGERGPAATVEGYTEMECVNGEMRPANARVVQEDGVTYYEFKHKNGRWERRFSMRESKRVGEAGPAGMGLFAERDYGSTERCYVCTGGWT